MRMTESRLRRMIRQVIKENDMADFEKKRDADPQRQNEELFNDLSQIMDLRKFNFSNIHYIVKHVMSDDELKEYRKMVDSYSSPRLKEILQRVEDEISKGAGGKVTVQSSVRPESRPIYNN